MHIGGGAGLGDEAQQVGDDLLPGVLLTDDEGGVAELLDEDRVMKAIGQVVLPERIMLIDDGEKIFGVFMTRTSTTSSNLISSMQLIYCSVP